MKIAPRPTALASAFAIVCVLGNLQAAAIVLGPARGNGTKQAPNSPTLPVNLAIIADKCKCKFVGHCTCGAAVEFMYCVADACATGQCECSSADFLKSCDSMALTCPSAGLSCTEEKATCLHQELPNNPTTAELAEELEKLRKRKCILQGAAEGGYLNAGKRLEEVKVYIQGHLDMLKAKGAEPFYTGCTPLPARAKISWIGGEAEGGGAAPLATESSAASAAAPAVSPAAVPATAAASKASINTQPPSYTSNNPSSPPSSSYFIPLLGNYCIYLLFVLICAYFYDQVRLRTQFPQVEGVHEPDAGFAYGLFGCFNDLKLCALSCCCMPIRWADTMNKADLISYWPGLAVVLILLTIEEFTWSLSTYLGTWASPFGVIASAMFVLYMVFYRQRLRRKYDIVADKPLTYVEDFFSWMCCPCCAAIQEARQVEAACDKTQADSKA